MLNDVYRDRRQSLATIRGYLRVYADEVNDYPTWASKLCRLGVLGSCAGYFRLASRAAPSWIYRSFLVMPLDECSERCGPGRSPQLVSAHPVGSRTGFWVMVSLRPPRSGPTVVAWFMPSPLNFNGWIPPRGARGGQPPYPGSRAACTLLQLCGMSSKFGGVFAKGAPPVDDEYFFDCFEGF